MPSTSDRELRVRRAMEYMTLALVHLVLCPGGSPVEGRTDGVEFTFDASAGVLRVRMIHAPELRGYL